IGTTAGGLLSIAADNIAEINYHLLPGINKMVSNLVVQGDALLMDVFEQGMYRFDGSGAPLPFTSEHFALSKDKTYVLAAGKQMYVYADAESASLYDAGLGLLQQLPIPSTHRFNTTNIKIFGSEALLGTDEGIFIVYPKTQGLSQFTPTNPGVNKS